ncbi:metal-dependent hydrolase [Sphingomonas sp. SFZ2018-12]|uniref:metal-dependent hydrolase n=1 Tax=Sphingomonas sp. SFZ2018-12 TaxID=2683197 RepID=UPI001F0E1B55|nr:metal-dependent hydrolase [Sphingomonas sp. SFZ2018-12]MCH4892070.1 metal-dependent hydrolase [Sphingomonas sp. SFZ2018-12]
MNAKTPADLEIRPRDRRFGRNTNVRRWWHGDDPVATAFYNALSVTFPKGEGFFIDSVRKFRDGTPPRLEREINAFVKQEVIHTREHVAFNRHVTNQGYDVSRLEARVDRELAITKGRPPIANLAATMALEHFTAIIAHQLIANPRHLAGADPEAAALWRWHAIEEIEHKGVAYDTWLHATRDWPRFRRWWVKSLVMVMATIKFFRGRTEGMLDLLAQDGLTGAGVKWRVFRYAFGRPGMARKVLGAWFAYFMPGFHPWNHDDRKLIALADSDYEAARLGQPTPELAAA